jgi:hypothetical protein
VFSVSNTKDTEEGLRYAEAKAEFIATVERLLAESAQTSR